MTIETWKQEFYPKNASERMSKKAAIEHSLRKWQGLTPSNLKKHGLEVMGKWIEEKDNGWHDLRIDSTSCALCKKYLSMEGNCSACPLAQLLGEPCDDNEDSPYQIWRSTGNPRPMIKALKKLADGEN